MTWHAKPSGYYSISSTEGNDNILEMAAQFTIATDEAKSAIIGNSVHEGGLNPWRWQYDSQSSVPNLGYGLFQFSPGSGYINQPGTMPNLSVTQQTQGANPADGATQCAFVASDTLGKWVSTCWRSYWNDSQGNPKYPDLYNYRSAILTLYGSGTSISLSDFMQIPDIEAATFVFLACFEGPKVPNYTDRANTAWKIYEIITGTTPPTPPTPPVPPPPVPPQPGNAPLWILKKIHDENFKFMC